MRSKPVSAPLPSEGQPVGDARVVELVVRPGERYQTIEHFGASDCWTCDPIGREWDEANREAIADLLFSRERGIGLSLWRFNVGAGGAWTDRDTLRDPWRGAECFRRSETSGYDWSRQAGQQWFLHAAKRCGVDSFLAFANSPPVWLTVNGRAHGDRATRSTNLRPDGEKPFAAFLADVLAHFRDEEEIPFRIVSPVNEPNWAWDTGGQEGCRYNNDDIVRVVRALHAELQRRRLPVEIDAPDAGHLVAMLDDADVRERARSEPALAGYFASSNNRLGFGKYGEYIHALIDDRDVGRMLGHAISAHVYWADQGESALVDLRRAVRDRLRRSDPGARYRMTEYCVMEGGRDLGMATALRVARVIHHDLTDGDAAAWHWWLAVSTYDYKDGLIYTDYRRDGRQNVLPSKVLWALGHYSRFIRPGARRVEISRRRMGDGRQPMGAGSTTGDELLASAYVNRDGRTPVVVLTNPGAAVETVRVSAGRSVARWIPYITSEADSLAKHDSRPAKEVFDVPARSLVTLVGETG